MAEICWIEEKPFIAEKSLFEEEIAKDTNIGYKLQEKALKKTTKTQ